MKRKLLLLYFVLLSTSLPLFAGKRDSSVNRFFAAVSISEPILKHIAKNPIDTSSTGISAPLLYVGHEGRLLMKRIGMSGNLTTTNTENVLKGDSKTIQNSRFRAIASWYYIKRLNEKWQFQCGLNVTAAMNFMDQISNSGYDQVNIYNRSFGAGIGPGILFQYKIGRRLTLFTEYMIFVQQFESEVGKKFSAIPSENFVNQNASIFGFQFEYPLSLYLQFHF